MDPQPLAPHIKKTITHRYGGVTCRYEVAQSLFSSHQIDTGTQHLLKSLADHDLSRTRRILDLGCGYGPLGISLAKLSPECELHVVDRDALAVAFARHNGKLNGIANLQAYGSLGYDSVSDSDFDLIVSNIPGKAGDAAIRAFLLGAARVLSPEGMVAVVVVSPLVPLVQETLVQEGIEVLLERTSAAHAVFHYRFTGQPIPNVPLRWDDGIYDRTSTTFLLDEVTLPLRTVRGLPEFDSLSYGSVLAYKSLSDLREDAYEHICIVTPGQGILPALLWQHFQPARVTLVGRDLLALRTSQQNLLDQGCPETALSLHHTTALVPPEADPDLVVGGLRDEGPTAAEHAVTIAGAALSRGTEMLLIGGSTPITRLLKSMSVGKLFRVAKRRRAKGNSSAIFVRK